MRSTHWFDDLLMIKFEEGRGRGNLHTTDRKEEHKAHVVVK